MNKKSCSTCRMTSICSVYIKHTEMVGRLSIIGVDFAELTDFIGNRCDLFTPFPVYDEDENEEIIVKSVEGDFNDMIQDTN